MTTYQKTTEKISLKTGISVTKPTHTWAMKDELFVAY